MATVENMTSEEKDFLAECEDEFKYRYTEKDEEFMKVFNAEPPTPPIVQNWWVPQSGGRRNDRRNNRRNQPYERSGNRDGGYQGRKDHYDRRDDRGYRGDSYRNQRPRY